MMKKLLLTLSIFLLSVLPAFSQEEIPKDTLGVLKDYSPEYLDTVEIKKKFVVNDYSMIGVEYGVTASMGRVSPSYSRSLLFLPLYTGVTFTHYQKMYGRHPYFGYEVGLFYGKQGYSFEQNSRHTIEGANQAIVDIVEIPVWMAMHFDSPYVKFMINLGPYGGYRLGIHRTNTYDETAVISYKDEFAPLDRRFEYGINGGVGVGFVIEPMEIHVNLRTRFSLSELHDPQAYIDPTVENPAWCYTYPWDFTLSVALQFHLTKRTGRTEASLRKEARKRVQESHSTK